MSFSEHDMSLNLNLQSRRKHLRAGSDRQIVGGKECAQASLPAYKRRKRHRFARKQASTIRKPKHLHGKRARIGSRAERIVRKRSCFAPSLSRLRDIRARLAPQRFRFRFKRSRFDLKASRLADRLASFQPELSCFRRARSRFRSQRSRSQIPFISQPRARAPPLAGRWGRLVAAFTFSVFPGPGHGGLRPLINDLNVDAKASKENFHHDYHY
jgi:hypothetical protein